MSQESGTPAPRGGHPAKAMGRRYRGASPLRTSVERPVALSTSFGARLRYRFDNALSRGAWVVIGYLGLFTLLIVVVLAAIAAAARAAGWGGAGSPSLGFFEAFWQLLLRSLDPGTFSGDASWVTRTLGLTITLAGIFIAGSLIGLISSAVDQQIDALRRGRSNVLEEGHSLILGWSPRVPTIVGELVIANESEKRAAVVVLADMDKTEMEEILRTAVPDMKTTLLVTRRGDPARMSDLELVSAPRARSIIVTGGNEGDAGAIKTSLAVLGLGLPESVPVIVDMASAAQAASLEAVTEGAVLTVNSDRLIAEVTAQACHERGLAHVVRELLDFDGDELYLQPFPDLVGSTYAQAQQAFDKAAVIGLAGPDEVYLNPPPDRVIGGGERILALVEDDSKFTFSGLKPIPDVSVGDEPDPEPPQRIVLVGWSSLAPQVLKELDEFLSPGSQITVVVDPGLVDPADAGMDTLPNSTVRVKPMTGGPELLSELLGEDEYDQGILLGYREGISGADADARTLLSLMALRKRWPKGVPPEVRLVAEVLDQRNVPIAEMAGVDDFIVSDQLASLMLAQLSERAELRAVFDELFDAQGASIALRPAGRFSRTGTSTFAEIVAAGNQFEESVLGYRLAAQAAVVLNPSKSAKIALLPEDEIIVVTTR